MEFESSAFARNGANGQRFGRIGRNEIHSSAPRSDLVLDDVVVSRVRSIPRVASVAPAALFKNAAGIRDIGRPGSVACARLFGCYDGIVLMKKR